MAKHLLLTTCSLAGLLLATAAQAQSGTALTGKVTSAPEPVMEGVLVSAKLDGSNVTTTVVTNAQGIYSFPADKLAPGHYSIATRAVGYRLDGPKAADVTAGAAATADITLAKTNALANQLSNGEWLNSLPGDDKLKAALTNCVAATPSSASCNRPTTPPSSCRCSSAWAPIRRARRRPIRRRSCPAATIRIARRCRRRSSRRWPIIWSASI